MTKRIFRSTFIVALVVFIASLILIMGVLYGYFSGTQKAQLKMQTSLAAQGVSHEGIGYFDGLKASDYRITWIGADGAVLYDDRKDSGEMENHMEREEIKEAFESGYGESQRYSDTLMERSLYAAVKLEDGTVLRLSVAQSSIFTLILGMAQPICVVFAVTIVLSLVLSYRLSRKIVEPLNKLDLDSPLSNDEYDEISPLLRRIESQQKQLKRQANQLQKKQDEFAAITGNMNEGLILLNPKGTVIGINAAAVKLLDMDDFCVGKNILAVNRNGRLQEVVFKAIAGNKAEGIMEIDDRRYQIDANPIISDEAVSGAVLLIFDVTERERAEQMRREFTANVSHELKTPLHSISGYAEIMKSDMVAEKDVKPFAEKIYSEAQRMVRLVEDIINLSHLDEGAMDLKYEKVDMYDMAEAVAASLRGEAASSGVSLELVGAHVVIDAIPQLLRGIIYNLCDNGIKYNRSGGKVTLCISSEGSDNVITVKDTGIGISPEHQSRIFERFYRVDKSHSKEVGGTGLGLSIVKHAAKIHNAKIEISSALNCGTEISVRFPKKQSFY